MEEETWKCEKCKAEGERKNGYFKVVSGVNEFYCAKCYCPNNVTGAPDENICVHCKRTTCTSHPSTKKMEQLSEEAKQKIKDDVKV